MKPTLTERLEALAIGYAKHRKALRDNAQAVRELHAECETYIDLKPFRNRYMSGEWLEPEEVLKWKGWLHAVDTIQAYDNEPWPMAEDNGFRCMAILLDERKAINADGAKIRRSLCVIGDQLIKARQ